MAGRLDTVGLAAVKDRLRAASAAAAVPMIARDGAGVTVLFDLAMNKLLKLDHAAGVTHWSVFFRLFWNDERLLYNGTAEFGQGWISPQDYISMDCESIWTPEVAPIYSTGYLLKSYGCGIYDEGFLRAKGYNVFWSQPGTIQVHCALHLEDFPFDAQECTLVVGPWVDRTFVLRSLHEGEVANPFNGDLSSEEWEVTSVREESVTTQYINGLFDEVHYTLAFKRYPHFYVVNAVLPMALVVTLSLLTMWLPINNGSSERLLFAVTLFLTILATALFTARYRPASKEETWLDRYQAVSCTLTALPVMESVLVTWLQHIYEKVSREEVEDKEKEVDEDQHASKWSARVEAASRDLPTRVSSRRSSLDSIDTKGSRRSGLEQLQDFSCEIRSGSVVQTARTALGANFRARLIVFLLHRMPSLEWLITGRRGEEQLNPRKIDRWFRIIISLVVVGLSVKVFNEIPGGVEGQTMQILLPPVFVSVACIGLAALLSIGMLVFRIAVLCSDRSKMTAQAEQEEQQPQQLESKQREEKEEEEEEREEDESESIAEHVVVDVEGTDRSFPDKVAQMDTETALKVLDAVVTSWDCGSGTWAQMTMEARCGALENLVKKLTEKKAEIVQDRLPAPGTPGGQPRLPTPPESLVTSPRSVA